MSDTLDRAREPSLLDQAIGDEILNGLAEMELDDETVNGLIHSICGLVERAADADRTRIALLDASNKDLVERNLWLQGECEQAMKQAVDATLRADRAEAERDAMWAVVEAAQQWCAAFARRDDMIIYEQFLCDALDAHTIRKADHE